MAKLISSSKLVNVKIFYSSLLLSNVFFLLSSLILHPQGTIIVKNAQYIAFKLCNFIAKCMRVRFWPQMHSEAS